MVHAYETWGFAGLSNELIDILNIWANFIYGPMLEDRVRTIAEDRNIGMYGRREAFKCIRACATRGRSEVPREFVFMDRAAIGLGGVFLHLNAELNFHRLFDDTIAGVDLGDVARRQKEAFTAAGRAPPEGSVQCTPRIARATAFMVSASGIRASNSTKGSGMHIDPAECHPAMDYRASKDLQDCSSSSRSAPSSALSSSWR